jgi:Fe2+ transport system protein B
MVLGKQGMRLEAFKFSLYIGIPIIASVAFNNTDVRRYWADYFQFLKYPANPNIGLKEQFEELQKERQLQKEQRQEYAEQMKRLQESAQRARETKNETTTKRSGWLW